MQQEHPHQIVIRGVRCHSFDVPSWKKKNPTGKHLLLVRNGTFGSCIEDILSMLSVSIGRWQRSIICSKYVYSSTQYILIMVRFGTNKSKTKKLSTRVLSRTMYNASIVLYIMWQRTLGYSLFSVPVYLHFYTSTSTS